MELLARSKAGRPSPARLATTSLILSAALLASCSDDDDENLGGTTNITLQFTDATAAAGLGVTHSTAAGFPGFAIMYSAAAAGDFDNDGWQDLFVLMGGNEPDKLFMNDGDGTFTEAAQFRGVARQHVGGGVAVGDFNGDGWLDMFVASLGDVASGPGAGQNLLYKNMGGGTFTEMAAAAGVATTTPGTLMDGNGDTDAVGDGFGAAWGDYDLDGDLDLFTTGWNGPSDGNLLFRNNGDETFTDVTDTAIDVDLAYVRGFTPRFLDMDGDRWPELLLTGDFGTSVYLVNNGDGTFSDRTVAAGVNKESNGMGQAVGDFDGDGLCDWFVSSIHSEVNPGAYFGNKLYRNLGNHVYEDVTDQAGVADAGWGWGSSATDLDNDGVLDLAVTGGWFGVGGEWTDEQSFLFRGESGLQFREDSANTSFSHFSGGRGMVVFDYDNDQDMDVVITAVNDDLTLLRNDASGTTNGLRVFLDTSADPTLAPNGYGAVVEATVNGRTQMRPICGGPTFLSQSELSAHFGFAGVDRIDELVVTWPDGSQTTLTDVATEQTLTIRK